MINILYPAKLFIFHGKKLKYDDFKELHYKHHANDTID